VDFRSPFVANPPIRFYRIQHFFVPVFLHFPSLSLCFLESPFCLQTFSSKVARLRLFVSHQWFSFLCSCGHGCGRDTAKRAGAPLAAANHSLNRSLSTNTEYRDVSLLSAGSRNVIVAGVEVVKPVHATGHRQDVLWLCPPRGWSEW